MGARSRLKSSTRSRKPRAPPSGERTPLPDPLRERVVIVTGGLTAAFVVRLWLSESDADVYLSPAWFLAVGLISQSLVTLRIALAWAGGLALAYASGRAFQTPSVPAPLTVLSALAVLGLAMLPRRAWLLPISRRGHWAGNTLLIRTAMLDRGRCPSCAHQVRPLSEKTKAWLTCDHCSALWRTPGYGVPSEPLTPTACPKCGYSLAGLSPDESLTIQCPECGTYTPTLPTRGEAVRDATGGLRCWGCGRSLDGLTLQYGDRVQCPDCGQWRSGLTTAGAGKPAEPPA